MNIYVALMMQALGRSYVRYFNSRHRRTGTLWEGRYRSCLVDSDEYLLQCQRYIEMNPVRAAMVATPGQYRWSSYRTHAHGKASRLTTPHSLYHRLGDTPTERQAAYRALFCEQLPAQLVENINQATLSGLALGNDKFRQQIKQLTGQAVKPHTPRRHPHHSPPPHQTTTATDSAPQPYPQNSQRRRPGDYCEAGTRQIKFYCSSDPHYTSGCTAHDAGF